MKLLRRGFLKGVAGLSATPGAGSLLACSNDAGGESSEDVMTVRSPLSELVADPEGILDLPEGYSYVILERTGDRMTDGHPMGERPDGMACFEGEDGEWILMRNHELDVGACPVPELGFNANMRGGVSRLVLNKSDLSRLSSNYVLVGTNRNCAGGPSEWGWLSCEESEDIGHGYVFVCDPMASETQEPRRAPSLGRFKHEAAAVDPETQIIYLTEDNRKSPLYRHVPTDSPFTGQLSAMKIRGEHQFDLGMGLEVGDAFEVEWVPIEDPQAEFVKTADQALAAGAAVVVRGEGCWFHGGSVFFVATEGGPNGLGQIFRLDPGERGDTLTLIAQADENNHLINPDNVTLSPQGELFVIEDNDGPNHIHRVGPDGTVQTLARNALDGGVSELCGVCFSPDGRVMFVNIQEPGITLAITGPFGSLA